MMDIEALILEHDLATLKSIRPYRLGLQNPVCQRLQERSTNIYFIKKIPDKTANSMRKATLEVLKIMS